MNVDSAIGSYLSDLSSDVDYLQTASATDLSGNEISAIAVDYSAFASHSKDLAAYASVLYSVQTDTDLPDSLYDQVLSSASSSFIKTLGFTPSDIEYDDYSSDEEEDDDDDNNNDSDFYATKTDFYHDDTSDFYATNTGYYDDDTSTATATNGIRVIYTGASTHNSTISSSNYNSVTSSATISTTKKAESSSTDDTTSTDDDSSSTEESSSTKLSSSSKTSSSSSSSSSSSQSSSAFGIVDNVNSFGISAGIAGAILALL